MLLLALIALLLYGGKLPEVAKSWGKTFAEFRRNLSGIQNEFHSAFYSEPDRLEYLPDTRPRDDAYAPETLEGEFLDETIQSENSNGNLDEAKLPEDERAEPETAKTPPTS